MLYSVENMPQHKNSILNSLFKVRVQKGEGEKLGDWDNSLYAPSATSKGNCGGQAKIFSYWAVYASVSLLNSIGLTDFYCSKTYSFF